MGDLSTHFDSREFRCRDGSEHPIDPTLIDMLEELRAELGGLPITITSGYRSPSYNRRVGGARNSYHVKGMAADIQVRGVDVQTVYDAAQRLFPETGGLGLYRRGSGGWVHVDARPSPARWRG